MSEHNETPALAVGGVDDGRCSAHPRGARCVLRNGHPGDCKSYPVPVAPTALHPKDWRDVAAERDKEQAAIERELARMPHLEVDADRARHRSACEEKRRAAWRGGFYWGLAVATIIGWTAILVGLYGPW